MDARVVILLTFVRVIAVSLRTTLLLFMIHGKVYRSTLDPCDVVLPITLRAPAVSSYDRKIACRLLRYTVAN
jgi:hypothetical protein